MLRAILADQRSSGARPGRALGTHSFSPNTQPTHKQKEHRQRIREKCVETADDHVSPINPVRQAYEIEALSALAPTLKEAELRVLLELMSRPRCGDGIEVTASSRELASATRVSRSWLRAAMASLEDRKIITTKPGTATRAAKHTLNFLEIISTGGSVANPPNPQYVGPQRTQYVGSLRTHPGSVADPPLFENTPLPSERPRVDVLRVGNPILDRVLNCKASKADPETLRYFRARLHSHMAKLGTDDTGQPLPQPHPPDDQVVAQFMACGDPPELERLLQTLFMDREPCQRYAWFVTVALQRLHGFSFGDVRKAREKLKLVKRGQPAPPPPELPTQQDLLAGIEAAAVKKAMR
jgi:hypothetical protein